MKRISDYPYDVKGKLWDDDKPKFKDDFMPLKTSKYVDFS